MNYLDETAKQNILCEWGRLIENSGAPGYPDPQIVPVCDALNRLPGICTISSCEGHGGHGSSGYLWIRLDRDTAEVFHQHAWTLAGKRGVWSLRFSYDRLEGPVVEITFPSGVAGARVTILGFFKHITKLADTIRRDKARWQRDGTGRVVDEGLGPKEGV